MKEKLYLSQSKYKNFTINDTNTGGHLTFNEQYLHFTNSKGKWECAHIFTEHNDSYILRGKKRIYIDRAIFWLYLFKGNKEQVAAILRRKKCENIIKTELNNIFITFEYGNAVMNFIDEL